MYYRQIEPPPDLTPWVECAWFLETALAPEGQLIVPDGRRELIFHFAARPLCAGLQQAGTLITSNLNQALELALTGTMKVFGVRLQPFASETGLAELEPRLESLYQQLGNARTEMEKLGLGWKALRYWTTPLALPDAAVAESIRLIEAARGIGPTGTFMPSGLAERQWQRRFRQATGLSPKAFARVTRFQYLIARYEANDFHSWAELALDTGFQDQSHLVNDFRAFCGQSPEAYFQSGRGMTEFYRDGFLQDPTAR